MLFRFKTLSASLSAQCVLGSRVMIYREGEENFLNPSALFYASNEKSKDMHDSKCEENKVKGVKSDNGGPRLGWSCVTWPLLTSECELQDVFEINNLCRPLPSYKQRRTRIANKGQEAAAGSQEEPRGGQGGR